MGLLSGITDALFGGNDPPPPDPNIGLSQKELAALATRQQDYFEKNFAPRYLDQIDQQISLGKQQSDAQTRLQDYQLQSMRRYDNRYWAEQVPLEEQLMGLAETYNEPMEQERLAGQAGADVEQAFGASRGALQRSLARRGVNLGSGAGISAMAQSANQEALARAGAMNMTREAARQLGWTRLGEAAALGRNLPSFGSTSAQLAGGFGMNAVNAGTAGTAALNAAAAASNASAGTAANMWGNVGQLGVQNTQLGLQAHQQNNAAQNAILGAAAGALTSWGTGFLPKP